MVGVRRVLGALLIFGSGMFVGPSLSWSKEQDLHELGRARLKITADLSDPKAVEAALGDLEGLFDVYVPRAPDTQITHRKVLPGVRGGHGPLILFKARKKVLGPVAMTFQVVGEGSTREISCRAPAMPQGVRYHLDLSRSEEAVRVNASSLDLEICLSPQGDGTLELDLKGTLTEGEDFGVIAGPMTVEILKSQLQPLREAILSQILVHQALELCSKVGQDLRVLNGIKHPSRCN